MTDYPRLCAMELRIAIYWWWQKLNTADIAEKLDVEECAVANSLADWREREFLKRRAA